MADYFSLSQLKHINNGFILTITNLDIFTLIYSHMIFNKFDNLYCHHIKNFGFSL